MTIFNILKTDHDKISELLDKLDKTTEKQGEKRKELFARFKKLMILHARTEEEAVYVPLKENEKTRDITFEAFEEHHLVDHLIEQLSGLSPSKEIWTAKMTVLKEMIEHHVEEEEGTMFKKMKSSLSDEELEAMATRMEELKHARTSSKRPHKKGTSTKHEVHAS